MMMSLAVATWILMQSPTSWDAVPGLTPPLGSLSDSVSVEGPAGVPSNEITQVVEFPGCPSRQVLWPQRFVLGATLAATKILDWSKQPLPNESLKQPDAMS